MSEKVCINDVVERRAGGGLALRVALGMLDATDDEVRQSSRVVLAVHAYNGAIDRERKEGLRAKGFVVHEERGER